MGIDQVNKSKALLYKFYSGTFSIDKSSLRFRSNVLGFIPHKDYLSGLL